MVGQRSKSVAASVLPRVGMLWHVWFLTMCVNDLSACWELAFGTGKYRAWEQFASCFVQVLCGTTLTIILSTHPKLGGVISLLWSDACKKKLLLLHWQQIEVQSSSEILRAQNYSFGSFGIPKLSWSVLVYDRIPAILWPLWRCLNFIWACTNQVGNGTVTSREGVEL